MKHKDQLYVGIDIAAKTFTAAWGTSATAIGPAEEFEQKQGDYKRLVSRLKTSGYPAAQMVVVIEASGTYWMRVAAYLHQAGLQISVINPRQACPYCQTTS